MSRGGQLIGIVLPVSTSAGSLRHTDQYHETFGSSGRADPASISREPYEPRHT